MDLRDLFKVLKKRKYIFITIPLVAMITSAIVSWYFIPPSYEATTTLMVGRNQTGQALPMDYAQILANKQLVKTYREIAQSRVISRQIISEADLNITPEQLNKKLRVELVEDTELIEIKVEDLKPKQALRLANIAAQVFMEKISSINNVNNVRILDPANLPKTPFKPNKKINVLLAGIVGIMVSTGLIILLEYMDTTFKTPEDVNKYLRVPVLGTIPNTTKHSKEDLGNV